ncbi:MAG TPA: ATP-binding protein [Candidatus Acidoferrum sp.]|nr:ATP-binding protein [Candidatus Acidoferrum sp.]
MLDSVRVRLTLWYTGLLALFLVLLSLITYFIFWRSTLQRTDSSLAELSEAFLTTVQAEMLDSHGPDAPKLATQEAIVEHRFRDHVFAVVDSKGSLLASSQDLPDESSPTALLSSAPFRKLIEESSSADRVFQNVKGGRSGYRAFVRKFPLKGQTYTLVILQSLHPQNEMLEEVRQTFAWVIPIAILLASMGGYFLARKSLAPVVAMSSQAGRISAENLHERLPIQNAKDELGRLAASFNELLERVDQSFERQRRFMSDASHELRTPAAILRGESEVALSRTERPAEEYRESLAVLHAEAQRLTQIVEDLFTLTRADAGQYPLSPHEFYLDELLADCTHAARSLALAKQITLTCEVPEELPIRADEALLRRMILNLLDNAIKYTPTRGRVTVSCERAGNEYALSVTDSGHGIPKDLHQRVFERFFRADKARTRSENDGGGAGLGLSIARWIAEAHHGRLILARSDSSGSTFTALLPAQVFVAPAAAPIAR